MKTTNLAQILSAVAIISGLLLVVWELQQTRTLARAQMIHDSFSDSYNYYLARMGEESSAVHIKACLTPEKLTPSEIAINHADTETLWLEMRRLVVLQAIANFDVADLEAYLPVPMALFLGRPLGWHKYETSIDSWPLELKAAAKKVVENNSIVKCEDQLQSMINTLAERGAER